MKTPRPRNLVLDGDDIVIPLKEGITEEEFSKIEANGWGSNYDHPLSRLQLGERSERVPEHLQIEEYPLQESGFLAHRREQQIKYAGKIARSGTAFVLCTPGFAVVHAPSFLKLLWIYIKFRVLRRPAVKGPLRVR